MDNQSYKCPLCGSILLRDHWVKITGQWDELEKQKANTKKLLDKAQKEKLELEKKILLEKKKATREGLVVGRQQGIKQEKSQRERMSKMLEKRTKDWETAVKQAQELRRQLKEGKTPQIEGFDYEKEVSRMLTEAFPEDRIQITGKMGDVIQFVKINDKEEVGCILYECKKTEKFDNQFVKDILQHQEVAKADYAVIITHASKNGKSKFFMVGDVIIIDPLGFLDIAFLLRNGLIDIHKMKLTKEEAKGKGVHILRYMQTGEFKNYMTDTVGQARKAYELLKSEVKEHQKTWVERIKIYATIHENTQNVRKSIGEIITGGPILLEPYEFRQLKSTEALKLESGD